MYKRDVTCAWPPSPLSQTVTPTRTPPPSSVTYFMDGPSIGALEVWRLRLFTHNIHFQFAYAISIWLRNLRRSVCWYRWDTFVWILEKLNWRPSADINYLIASLVALLLRFKFNLCFGLWSECDAGPSLSVGDGVGHDGALVESIPFYWRVVGSNPAIAAT